MKKSASIEIIVCDSCENRVIIGDAGDTSNEEVPEGWFHGTVQGWDGIQEWSACKPAHIKAAVLAVLDLLP